MALGKISKPDTSPCDGLPTRMYGNSRSIYVHMGKDWGLDSPFGGGKVLADATNLSPRKGSTPASRLLRRGFIKGYGSGDPHGMIMFNGSLFFVNGSNIYSTPDGVNVSLVAKTTDTYKNFVIFGDRLYIYPDKIYVTKGGAARPLDLKTESIENVEFRDNVICLPEGYTWEGLGFSAGDGVKVEGTNTVYTAPDGYYHICSFNGSVATLSQNFPTPCTGHARFVRKVPNLTAACVCGDRVYGIEGKNVYISASGSATDFYSDSTVSGNHAASLSSDADGDFTALSPWQGYVVCFKSDRICKLLGSRADSFTLQDRQGVGVPSALSRTLCEVGDALYYAASGGVWRYRGQEPEWVCSLGGATAQNGCGGTDGRAYYLSVTANGKTRMCLYIPENGKWYPEDDMQVGAMFCHDGLLWMQGKKGVVWTTASDGRTLGSGILEEEQTGLVVASMTLATDRSEDPGLLRPTAVWVRATGKDGYLKIYASYGDGAIGMDAADGEVLLGEFSAPMNDRLLKVTVHERLYDGVCIRLETAGDWVIHDVIRRYEVIQP